jgi:TPR repeat protein
MLLGDYDKAISEFTQHLEFCSDKFSFEKLARCYFNKNDIERAKSNFMKACEMGYIFSCNQLEYVKKYKTLYSK